MRSRSKLFPGLVAVLAAWVLGVPAFAQDRVFTADPAQSRVDFTVGATMHTVHGTFRLKSGTLRFNTATGVAEGQLVVDAESGDSENKSRDGKMKKEILETHIFYELNGH